ncbi:hypothetical protein FRB94_014529 [Tulasnella sp. JGI-2019a]|nr:hypothetical protein FRB94_014529 [Tulasnella sp. JGI-2019a]KAG9032387.1 hypothetical protein FRB95_001508 [Tulasnella sp. JGI-2019a]
MLADSRKAPRQFIKDLRPICEIVFALLLTAHAQALHSQAETDSEEAKPVWVRGAETAGEVLNDCHRLTSSAHNDVADHAAEQTLKKLSLSIMLLPTGAAQGNDLMECYEGG